MIFLKSGTKKLCIFLTGGAYVPYAPCMSTPPSSGGSGFCWMYHGFKYSFM